MVGYFEEGRQAKRKTGETRNVTVHSQKDWRERERELTVKRESRYVKSNKSIMLHMDTFHRYPFRVGNMVAVRVSYNTRRSDA